MLPIAFLYIIPNKLLQYINLKVDNRTRPTNSATPDPAAAEHFVQDNNYDNNNNNNYVEISISSSTSLLSPSSTFQRPPAMVTMSLDDRQPPSLRDLQPSTGNLKPLTNLSVFSPDTPPSILSYRPSYDRDFYQYGWFRGLTVLAVIFISQPIIYGIAFSGLSTFELFRLIFFAQYWLVPEVFGLTLYVTLFVVLEDSGHAIERFFEDKLHISPSFQRRVKVSLHVYLGTLVVCAAFLPLLILTVNGDI